jgi:hypothetical protein
MDHPLAAAKTYLAATYQWNEGEVPLLHRKVFRNFSKLVYRAQEEVAFIHEPICNWQEPDFP